jgi:hypothetical protein
MNRYWDIRILEVGNNLPREYFKDVQKHDRSSILHNLEVIQQIEIPREWPNTKLIRYDDLSFYQLSVGDHRIYLHLDTEKEARRIIVCYACRKTSKQAREKDLNRVVTNIRNYVYHRRE